MSVAFDDHRSSCSVIHGLGRPEHLVAKVRVQAVPGVAAARVNLSQKRLIVDFKAGEVDPAAVVAALDGLGYPSTPYDPQEASQAHGREGRELVLALAVAGFGVMNTMMFSVPIWAGLFGQELGPATRTLMLPGTLS